jgi:hypothetical protein
MKESHGERKIVWFANQTEIKPGRNQTFFLNPLCNTLVQQSIQTFPYLVAAGLIANVRRLATSSASVSSPLPRPILRTLPLGSHKKESTENMLFKFIPLTVGFQADESTEHQHYKN